MSHIYFCVVRRTEGRDWFDVSTMSGDRETCVANAHDRDGRIPQWASANPLVRIAQVNISEVR